MTELEITNCKDYNAVKSIIEHWNKPDSHFRIIFDDFEDYKIRVYRWTVGSVRWRMLGRAPWNKLILFNS